MPETDFMDTRPPENGRWHFNREIHLGHIVTTTVMLVSVITYALKQEQRISLIEYQINEQVKRDDRQDAQYSLATHDMADRLDKIENKLDRIIERNNLLNGASSSVHARP
jgi:cell division protein FtsL